MQSENSATHVTCYNCTRRASRYYVGQAWLPICQSKDCQADAALMSCLSRVPVLEDSHGNPESTSLRAHDLLRKFQ